MRARIRSDTRESVPNIHFTTPSALITCCNKSTVITRMLPIYDCVYNTGGLKWMLCSEEWSVDIGHGQLRGPRLRLGIALPGMSRVLDHIRLVTVLCRNQSIYFCKKKMQIIFSFPYQSHADDGDLQWTASQEAL